MKKNKIFLILLLAYSFSFSQGSLLMELEDESENKSSNEISTFKAIKIVNNQSTKQASEKELYLYVSHRFGSINGGIKTLFGLDIANTKIELLYGLSKNLQIGSGDSSDTEVTPLISKDQMLDQFHYLELDQYFQPAFDLLD